MRFLWRAASYRGRSLPCWHAFSRLRPCGEAKSVIHIKGLLGAFTTICPASASRRRAAPGSGERAPDQKARSKPRRMLRGRSGVICS
jgi:hypothetical protein